MVHRLGVGEIQHASKLVRGFGGDIVANGIYALDIEALLPE